MSVLQNRIHRSLDLYPEDLEVLDALKRLLTSSAKTFKVAKASPANPNLDLSTLTSREFLIIDLKNLDKFESFAFISKGHEGVSIDSVVLSNGSSTSPAVRTNGVWTLQSFSGVHKYKDWSMFLCACCEIEIWPILAIYSHNASYNTLNYHQNKLNIMTQINSPQPMEIFQDVLQKR